MLLLVWVVKNDRILTSDSKWSWTVHGKGDGESQEDTSCLLFPICPWGSGQEVGSLLSPNKYSPFILKMQVVTVVQLLSCVWLCNPVDCSMAGFPVLHHHPEFVQTHVHWVSDAIWPSHPLSSPSPPAPNLSQLQGCLQWVSCLHWVAKVLVFKLQYQSFQWVFRVYFL